MTQEEFEAEAEELKQMMLDFYRIRDKGERKVFKKMILYYVHRLLKI